MYIYIFFAEFYLITLFNVFVTLVKIDYPYNVRMSEDQGFKQIWSCADFVKIVMHVTSFYKHINELLWTKTVLISSVRLES